MTERLPARLEAANDRGLRMTEDSRAGPIMTPEEVDARLRELARVPVLLVACDYDGTLAPIIDNPDEARPLRESVAGLRQLAAMPDTHVAVISGRALRDLAALSRLPEEIHLVGSHGTEFDVGFAEHLSAEQRDLRDRVMGALNDIARRDHGFIIEPKPAGVAFHYRKADPEIAGAAVTDVLKGPGKWKGVHLKTGKMVVELSVLNLNKGDALDRLRADVSAEAVVFAGDDATDEDAFARLAGPDLGLKVGHGQTLARARLDDPQSVAQMLALLAERRRAWLTGEHALPIERHSLLSDQRTVALVTADGSVNWMCHPRADSPAVFAGLLGGARAGHFSVSRPDDSPPISHRYLNGTMITETRWSDVTVTDYLDCSDQRPTEPAGRTNLIRAIEGTGRIRIEFAPRLDFGRAPTGLHVIDGGLEVWGAAETMVLAVARSELGNRRPRPPPDGSRRRPARRDPSGVDAAPRRPRPAPSHRLDRNRPPTSHRAALAQLGTEADAAPGGQRGSGAVGAGAQSTVPPALRRHAGRCHHQPARGDGRGPQLGLPLLLAPRRRHERSRPTSPGQQRGGRQPARLDSRASRAPPQP